MSLDQPIAANCDPTLFDDIRLLQMFGYFMADPSLACGKNLLPNGGFDTNEDNVADSHDTVCYHSNIQQAFLS